MQDAMDLIVDSDALAAADLRKGFSNNIDALPGEMQMRNESLEENLNRTNYRIADNVDYLDGDVEVSSFDFAQSEGRSNEGQARLQLRRIHPHQQPQPRLQRRWLGRPCVLPHSWHASLSSTNVNLGVHRIPLRHGPRGHTGAIRRTMILDVPKTTSTT